MKESLPPRPPTDDYHCPSAHPFYEPIKRIFDVVVAGLVLTALSPMWVAIGLIIRLTSPGPALFRGDVVGHRGRTFRYYKFRTMVAGDDSHHKDWLRTFVTADQPYEGGDYKVRSDPRVTNVGRLLRRTSLDEIPQMINVLRGEMSVVGPRPPVPYEFEMYDAWSRQRLAVPPGITGLYQVTARSRVPFSTMVRIDLDYIARRSLWLDLAIVARTFGAMLGGRGAG